MVYTLEKYLLTLHTGQWFGFNNLNGDDENTKIYANLVIHSEDAKPTEQECTDGVASLQAEYDSQEYARDRAPEYPSTGDQLDMLWHAIDTGDWTAAKVKLTSFYTELKAVKDKYPKE